MDEVTSHSSMSDYSEIVDATNLIWENALSNWEDVVKGFKAPTDYTETTIASAVFTEVTIS
jgi:hypothetical protein